MALTSVHASRNDAGRAPPIAKILGVAAVVGLLESAVGAFALHDDPLVGRIVYLVMLNWVGAGYGILGYLLARRMAWFRASFWRRVLAADLVTLVPQALTSWGSTWLVGVNLGPETLWLFLGNTFLLSGACLAAFIGPILDRALEPAVGAAPVPSPTSFLARLPLRLRTAELWALKAEDHYLRAITSGGEALIRMRLADAIKELTGVDGVRCHRSWWIARTSVADVRRADGRLRTVLLPNGLEVPVSRAGARILKAGRESR